MRYFVATHDILRDQVEVAPQHPNEIIFREGDYLYAQMEHPIGWVYAGKTGDPRQTLVPLSALREVEQRVYVTLSFNNETEKNKFMGQLSDGWGENYCTLKWQGNFDTANQFHIENTDWEEELRERIRNE